MKDKIFKAIKCVLFMLPFVFVGGKTLYTILNENAKDSYTYGNKIDFIDVNASNSLQGNTLYFRYDSSETNYGYTQQYLYSWISIDFNDYISGYSSAVTYVPDGIQLYSQGILRLHNPNNNEWSSYNTNIYNENGIWGITLTNFSLILKENVANPFRGGSAKIQVMYPLQLTLDTAFENSLSEFNNIGFGKIDFLEWFNDLFLNDNFNNVYSTFINSYLNYFLFVELVMFIPSVFHWVIHFFTEIGNNALTRSTKKKGDE